jgi:hypothetical protein
MSSFKYDPIGSGELGFRSNLHKLSPNVQNFSERNQDAINSLSDLILLQEQGILEEGFLDSYLYKSAKEINMDPSILLEQAKLKSKMDSTEVQSEIKNG